MILPVPVRYFGMTARTVFFGLTAWFILKSITMLERMYASSQESPSDFWIYPTAASEAACAASSSESPDAITHCTVSCLKDRPFTLSALDHIKPQCNLRSNLASCHAYLAVTHCSVTVADGKVRPPDLQEDRGLSPR